MLNLELDSNGVMSTQLNLKKLLNFVSKLERKNNFFLKNNKKLVLDSMHYHIKDWSILQVI